MNSKINDENKIVLKPNENKFRIAIVTVISLICFAVTMYFHLVLNTGIIITHLFYFPIILAAFWWRKKGIIVAVAISVLLIIADLLFDSSAHFFNDIARSVIFILISYIVSGLSDLIYITKQEKVDIEHKYKLLFDHMTSAVSYNKIEIDENGKPVNYKILDINKNYEKIFSLKRSKIIGKNVLDIYSGIEGFNNDWILKFEKVALKSETIKFDHYFPHINRWLSIEAFSLKKDFFVTTFEDITENKKAIEEKEQIQKQIQYSERLASIGLLAAGVGHEINNPLTIIQLNADDINDYLEEKNCIDDFLIKKITKQNEAIARISDIVKGLKTYAREDVDVIKDVNVHKLLKNCFSLVRSIYQKENITIEDNLLASKFIVRGNNGKIQQVLMNFLSNAKDSLSKKSGGLITVNTESKDNYLIITVSDTGEGISKENIKRIFDTFYTTKPPGKGTGLGLSISHSIVTELGGTITVKSNLGEGSTFIITLPANDITIIEEENLQDKKEMKQMQGSVLVVDDEIDILNIMKRYFIKLGFNVDIANNGEQALEKLKDNNYDFLFTDLKMPGIDGEELINRAKALDLLRDARVFVITGGLLNEYSEHQIDSLKQNVDGFIQKPFSKETLYNILEKYNQNT